MKKIFVILFFTLLTVLTYAIPSGDYYKVKRDGSKDYNRYVIVNNTRKSITLVSNRDVVVDWDIVEEKYDGAQDATVIRVKSPYGVYKTIYSYKENGKTYLQIDNNVYVLS